MRNLHPLGRIFTLLLCLALTMSACSAAATPQPASPTPASPPATMPPTATAVPTPTPAATPSATPLPAATAASLAPMSDFMKGVAYTSYSADEYSSPLSDKTLVQVIKPMGVTWITILATCYQENVSSTQIQCGANTPTDTALAHAVQAAHNNGLRVMLKPQLELSNDTAHWRGQIDFGSDETAWKQWFATYTSFIGHYAALARQTGADTFVIGTELPGTSGRAGQWRELIGTLKGLYSGPLAYASNWDETDNVTWWDAVDEIGIDAYFPLGQSPQPSVAELKAAWAPIVAHMGAFSKKWDRPIIFTEIGYRSVAGANLRPYDYQFSAPLDLQVQANCYQAVFESLAGQSWWHGAFWWSWSPNPAQGGPFDTDYTANNKPAEDILRVNYGSPARPTPTPTPVLAADPNNVLVIYADGLGAGWENWSWDSTVDLNSAGLVYKGSSAISVAFKNWGALSFHHDPLPTTPYYWLEFQINVGKNTDRQLVIYLNDATDAELPQRINLPNPLYLQGGAFKANQWQWVRIPLAELGAAQSATTRVNIKDNSGNGQDTLLIDEIRFVGAVPTK